MTFEEAICKLELLIAEIKLKRKAKKILKELEKEWETK